MKFLFVAPRVHPNQTPIISGLINNGHQVAFFVQNKEMYEEYSGAEIIIIRPAKKTTYLYKIIKIFKGDNFLKENKVDLFIPDVKQLKNELSRFRPDIVILRDMNLFSLAAFKLYNKNICKFILYNQAPKFSHNSDESFGIKKFIKYFVSRLFPHTRITTVRYKDYPLYPSTYEDDANSFFLPFVVRDTSEIKSNYCTDGIVHLLDSGKYRDYKNHFFVVDAAVKLRGMGYKNFRLTIQGQAVSEEEKQYFNKLKDYIYANNATQYISLLPGMTYQEMEPLFIDNDIFILASKREVANISILDAMTYGLPVICTSANGTADYIIDGKSGDIYESGKLDSLVMKIKFYLDNEYCVKERGRYALDYAKKEFSFQAYYGKLLSIIK